MPRRKKEYKNKKYIKPDPVYGSLLVAKFINNIMKRGKKTLAMRLFYETMKIVGEKTGREPIEVFEQAIKNLMPVMEVRSRRVGGATYQVPVEVRTERRYALAMRWLLTYARQRRGKSFPEKLAAEMIDAANNTGAAIKKKEDTHRMAEANRAFSQFRW